MSDDQVYLCRAINYWADEGLLDHSLIRKLNQTYGEYEVIQALRYLRGFCRPRHPAGYLRWLLNR